MKECSFPNMWSSPTHNSLNFFSLSWYIWYISWIWERIDLHQNFLNSDIALKLTTRLCRVFNIFHCRIPLTIQSNEKIKFQPQMIRLLVLFHWNIIQKKNIYKDLLTVRRLIGTLLIRIFFMYCYYFMGMGIELFFFLESYVVSRYIALINFLSKLCFCYI